MPQRRVDPAESDAPRVIALITSEQRARIIELAQQSGMSRSAAARELIQRGIDAIDRGPPDDDDDN